MTAPKVAAHTPGPWYVEVTEHDGVCVWSEKPQMAVCEVSYPADEHPASFKDEAVANAVLIAAAPDMLAALEAVYSDLQRFAPNSAGSILARAAIAKAKP